MDAMREFGAMAFASRLKRLGDRLKGEATRLYRANGVEFNDSWFLVAFVLSKRDGISVTEIADTLGISHAAISQMAAAMKRKRLLVTRPDNRDGRRTLLYLTKKGQSAVDSMQPIWNVIGECTEELLASTGKDPLRAICEIEERLEKQSLFTRVTEHMKKDSHSRGG
jgi:DNA-binding MarR family transcriptional regulator